jgi:hypothetical protein
MLNYDDDELFSSDDSDILGSNKTRSSKYSMRGDSPFKDILEEFVNQNPNVLESMYTNSGVGFQVPLSIKLFKDITRIFSSRFSTMGSGHSSSYDRAAIQLLDEMTGGQVTQRALIFESEKFIVCAHDVINTANQMYMILSECGLPHTGNSLSFMGHLGFYLKIMLYTRSKMIEEYNVACAQAGILPNQSVIDFGVIEFADRAYMAADGNPVYNSHYSFGDVKEIRTLLHKQYDYLSKALIRLIFTGDPVAYDETLTANATA